MQHKANIHSLRVNQGRVASTSIDAAMLWSVQVPYIILFSRSYTSISYLVRSLSNPCQYRSLGGSGTVGVTDVLFTPDGRFLITCFRDESIAVWIAATLEVYQRFLSPAQVYFRLHYINIHSYGHSL